MLLTFFKTVRHLKLRQIFFLIYYKIYKPKIVLSHNLDFNDINILDAQFLTNQYNPIINQKKNLFKFLNRTLKIDKNFQCFNAEKLWKYNLHYFDFLNSSKLSKNIKLDIINKWHKYLAKVNDERLEPYPSSIRITNLIKFSIQNRYFNKKLINSIWSQAIFLSKLIEYHIQGNHLITNYKALIFASFFFKNSKKKFNSDFLLKKYLAEIKSQFTKKFFHKEGSALYQRIILEDVYDIYIIIERSNFDKKDYYLNLYKQLLLDIAKSTELILFSNFKQNYINDSFYREDLSNNYELFRSIYKKFKISNNKNNYFFSDDWIVYKNEHYKIMINAFDDILHCQPGHIHAGLLSFELEINNKSFFRNRGTSTYKENKRRILERSTRSSNTLEFNNDNSSEIWRSFRVANRAKIVNKEIKKFKNKIIIKLSHDGYFKKYNFIHYRKFTLFSKRITIEDHIEPNIDKNKIKLRYFLDNNCKIGNYHKNYISVTSGNTNVKICTNFSNYVKKAYISKGMNNISYSNMIISKSILNKNIMEIKW